LRTWIKFCGCTSWDDVEMAMDAGADAVGMIFAPSPRRIAWEAATEIARRLPPSIEVVAVFVDPAEREVAAVRELFGERRVTITPQFSGDELPGTLAPYGKEAIKTLHVDDASERNEVAAAGARFARARLLFDTKRPGSAGGTGATFPWELVAGIAQRRAVVIAGGLTPENVAECVRRVRPFGVDVRSGVESGGRKDLDKMRAFTRAVRSADAT
jgi:phosphoribosylanthranilate isomerase